MPKEITEPMFVARSLCWDIHVDGPQTTFFANQTIFKYAMGLRPRARDDEKKAEALARKNWSVLELIGRDALASGAVKTDASKGWRVTHSIADDSFSRLLKKYDDQLAKR